jgi:hypothetical protein
MMRQKEKKFMPDTKKIRIYLKKTPIGKKTVFFKAKNW